MSEVHTVEIRCGICGTEFKYEGDHWIVANDALETFFDKHQCTPGPRHVNIFQDGELLPIAPNGRMPVCGCPVGTICNSTACPHALQITCGVTTDEQ